MWIHSSVTFCILYQIYKTVVDAAKSSIPSVQSVCRLCTVPPTPPLNTLTRPSEHSNHGPIKPYPHYIYIYIYNMHVYWCTYARKLTHIHPYTSAHTYIHSHAVAIDLVITGLAPQRKVASTRRLRWQQKLPHRLYLATRITA